MTILTLCDVLAVDFFFFSSSIFKVLIYDSWSGQDVKRVGYSGDLL